MSVSVSLVLKSKLFFSSNICWYLIV